MIYIVTQCFFPNRGGIEAVMTGLADHLTALGRRVRVFADGHAANDGAKPYPIERFSGPRPWRRWRKRSAIARATRSAAVTGIFTDSWKSLDAVPRGAHPIAMLAHGAEFPEAPSSAKRARLVAAVARADVVIANSEFTAERVRPYLGERPGRLRVIYPPIENQPRPSAAAIAQARNLIGDSGPVLTTVARLEPRKGVDMTLRALPGLSRGHPGLIYVVAGAGEDEGRLRTLARSLGVESRVRFAGAIDDELREALLAATDVFAMPVRREGRSVEGFGLSYIEAARHGVPSVAGQEGGAASAVLDGETGLLCDGAGATAVEAALDRLLGDEALRAKLGAAAALRARTFAWDRRAPEYLAAIELN